MAYAHSRVQRNQPEVSPVTPPKFLDVMPRYRAKRRRVVIKTAAALA